MFFSNDDNMLTLTHHKVTWILILLYAKMCLNFIRIACSCVLYRLTPHFYIVKLGFIGVYIIFLVLP